MIRVSIIIPVYNAEAYIEKAVESALSQTLDEVEIIAVNDGSTDKSLSILQGYEKLYENVHVYSQTNQKQGAARNLGLSMAKGKYVYFLDADDYLVPEAMRTCWIRMEEEALDLLTFDADTVIEAGAEDSSSVRQYVRSDLEIEEGVWKGRDFFHLYWEKRGVFIAPWSVMLRRSFLEENRIQFIPGIYFEDNAFCLEIYQRAERGKYLSQKLYNRRFRQNSVMVSDYTAFHLFSYLVSVKEIFDIAVRESDDSVYSSDRQKFWMHNVRLLLNLWGQFERCEDDGCRTAFIALMDRISGEAELLAKKDESGKIIMLSKRLQEEALRVWEHDRSVAEACRRNELAIKDMGTFRAEKYIQQMDLDGKMIGFWGNNRCIKKLLSRYIRSRGPALARLFYLARNEDFSDRYWENCVLDCRGAKTEELDFVYVVRGDLEDPAVCGRWKDKAVEIPAYVQEYLDRLVEEEANGDVWEEMAGSAAEIGRLFESKADAEIKSAVSERWLNQNAGMERAVEEALKDGKEQAEKLLTAIQGAVCAGIYCYHQEPAGKIRHRLEKVTALLAEEEKYAQQAEICLKLCRIWKKSVRMYERVWSTCTEEEVRQVSGRTAEMQRCRKEAFDRIYVTFTAEAAETAENELKPMLGSVKDMIAIQRMVLAVRNMEAVMFSDAGYEEKESAVLKEWEQNVTADKKMIKRLSAEAGCAQDLLDALESFLLCGMFILIRFNSEIITYAEKLLKKLARSEIHEQQASRCLTLCQEWKKNVTRLTRAQEKHVQQARSCREWEMIEAEAGKTAGEAKALFMSGQECAETLSSLGKDLVRRADRIMEITDFMYGMGLDQNIRVGFWGRNNLIKRSLYEYSRHFGPIYAKIFYVRQSEEFSDKYWEGCSIKTEEMRDAGLDLVFDYKKRPEELKRDLGKAEKGRVIGVPGKVIRYLERHEEVSGISDVREHLEQLAEIFGSGKEEALKENAVRFWLRKTPDMERKMKDCRNAEPSQVRRAFEALQKVLRCEKRMIQADSENKAAYQIEKFLGSFADIPWLQAEAERELELCSQWKRSIRKRKRVKHGKG